MTPVDVQQRQLLERLQKAGGAPVTFAELRVDGIAFPAAIVSELELSGYAIDRVHYHGRLIGVRLLELEQGDQPTQASRRRMTWRHR